MEWRLWFVQFSGWPALLASVGAVFVFMLLVSVAMTWLGNRSVVQSVLLTVLALAVIAFGIVGAVALLSRW
jgi:hypothetical protein